MVRKEPVSVNWQTLFVIIPIVDLWATYRIEKLRLYLLVMIAIAVTGFVIEIAIFGIDAYFSEQEDFTSNSWFQSAILLVEIGIAIILVRKWSSEWNENILFEGKSRENEEDDDTETRYRLD